jgi:hypothetical protein
MAGGGLGNHDYRVPSRAWFVQDDWRASKTLTFNLGFRNEFIGAPYDLLCHTGNSNRVWQPQQGSRSFIPNARTSSI